MPLVPIQAAGYGGVNARAAFGRHEKLLKDLPHFLDDEESRGSLHFSI